jgi:hypothetical protein
MFDWLDRSEINRRLQVRGAAVYWNTSAANHQWSNERVFRECLSTPFNTPSSSSSTSGNSNSTKPNNSNTNDDINNGSFAYLVSPSDMECRIRQRKSVTSTLPRISATMMLGDISAGISSQQFSIAAAYGVDVATFASRLRHAPYCPPLARPTLNGIVARKWWRYAISVVTSRVHHKRLEWSATYMRDSLSDYRFYSTLHQQRMRALRQAARHSTSSIISPEVMTGLARIERKIRNVHLLLAWRQSAEEDAQLNEALAQLASLRRERGDDDHDANNDDDMLDVPITPTPTASAPSRTSWFSSLFGGGASSSAQSLTSGGEDVPTLSLHDLRDDGKRNDTRDNDKRTLINQLGYCPWSEPRWLDYATELALSTSEVDEPTRADVRLQLGSASCHLCDDIVDELTLRHRRIPFVTAAIARFGVTCK